MTTQRVPLHVLAEDRRIPGKYGLRRAVPADWTDEVAARDPGAAKRLGRPPEAAPSDSPRAVSRPRTARTTRTASRRGSSALPSLYAIRRLRNLPSASPP